MHLCTFHLPSIQWKSFQEKLKFHMIWWMICFQLLQLRATLLKVTLPHGCFSRFLICTNATKSRNAPKLSISGDGYINHITFMFQKRILGPITHLWWSFFSENSLPLYRLSYYKKKRNTSVKLKNPKILLNKNKFLRYRTCCDSI